jgi:hypothetical protein
LSQDGTYTTPSSGGGSPAGSTTQLQYNNAGAFGGITGATTNGTVVTLTSPVFITPALGTPASGVTIRSRTGMVKIYTQHSVIYLTKLFDNELLLYRDLTT